MEFSQVGLLARAGEMEEEGVLQLRTKKTDPKCFAGLFFKQAFSHFSKTMDRRVAPHDPRTLRGNLHPL